MSERKGNAGTIMVIMILGFLMTITTAYMKMVQTESEIQTMIDNSDRALDAAFSGVQYAMSVAQTRKEMFINDVTLVKDRIYFIDSAQTPDWDPTADDPNTTYTATFTTDWFFFDGDMNFMEIDDNLNKPYVFRVTTYASHTASVLITDEYIIKSQGKYIEYSDDNVNIINEYKAQVIAVVGIDFTRKTLRLKAWRQMPFQTSDSDFFAVTEF
jgi:hypothetical protein